MFCRCRYLRTFQLESLFSTTASSISTRYVSKILPASRNFSQVPNDPSPSCHDEKAFDDGDTSVLEVGDLLGSARSPLAFKPLPVSEADLELEWEDEVPQPVTLHTEDPLLARRRNASSPGPTKVAESVKKSRDTDPNFLPWDEYVKILKTEKAERQRARAKPFLDPVLAVQEWDHIRTWDRFQIANLSVLHWVLLAKAGCMLSEPSVLCNLPVELVDAHSHSPKAQGSMVTTVLQKIVPKHEEISAFHPVFQPLLEPWDCLPISFSDTGAEFRRNIERLALDLFSEYFQDKPPLVAKLPRYMILWLTTAAASRCPKVLNHGGLLNAFFQAVRRDGSKLHLTFPSHGSTPFHDVPTGHVWALFRLVQDHINSESRREAFVLFQRLVKEKMITPSAISQVNINREEPRTALLFAMAKTCLDYEWYTGALELMILAATHDPTIFDEQMKALVNETLYVLFQQAASTTPTHKYKVRLPVDVERTSARRAPEGPRFLLRRFMALITALRRDSPAFSIEDRVIQGFYDLARRLDYSKIAEALFSFGRIYKPPPPVPPLLVSPSFKVSDSQLSSSLHPVEPHHIAFESPLQLTPKSVTQYPVPDGPPLLWLLEAMLKKSGNVHLCRHLAREVVNSNIHIPVYDRGQFIRLLASAGLAHPAKELWKRYSHDETGGVAGHSGAMLRLVSLFHHLGKRFDERKATTDDGSESSGLLSICSSDLDGDDGIKMEAIEGEDANVLSGVNEARDFAKEVVEKFKACKEPIRTASYHDINALARAYFVLNRSEDGFEYLRIAKEVRPPDMHDVNVGISGVAKCNVGIASKVVDRMHEQGLVPDAVTWGTLIHLAFLEEDVGLVVSLVQRANQRGVSTFSSRTIGSLIRASLLEIPPGSQLPSYRVVLGEKSGVGLLELTLGGEGSVEQIERNLVMAYHLVGTLDTQAFVGKWSLANYCLNRAMWVGDAATAYEFWSKYLGKKTQWNYPDQVRSRKKLYELVETAKKEGKLEASRATNMLRRLSKT